MTQPDTSGYHGEEDAFAAYTAGMNPLADDLRAGARRIAPHGDFGDDDFSIIGNEVGLAQAIREATQRQLKQIHGLADSMGGTAEAVRNTWTNMQSTEADAEASLRRAAGDLS